MFVCTRIMNTDSDPVHYISGELNHLHPGSLMLEYCTLRSNADSCLPRLHGVCYSPAHSRHTNSRCGRSTRVDKPATKHWTRLTKLFINGLARLCSQQSEQSWGWSRLPGIMASCAARAAMHCPPSHTCSSSPNSRAPCSL